MVALTHWICFTLFFKRIADVMASHLSVMFLLLVHLGSFLA